MKWLFIVLLILPLAHARIVKEGVDFSERLTLPHIYPGQTIVSSERFMEDPLRPGTSTVRWTTKAAYSINSDRIHLMRGSYTLLIRSKLGPNIRVIPFDTTKVYLEPNYFRIRFDKGTNTIWLARYAD